MVVLQLLWTAVMWHYAMRLCTQSGEDSTPIIAACSIPACDAWAIASWVMKLQRCKVAFEQSILSSTQHPV